MVFGLFFVFVLIFVNIDKISLLVFINLANRNVDFGFVPFRLDVMDLIKNIFNTSWNEASKISGFFVERTIHSESFTASSLTVSKDADIFAVKRALDKFGKLIEQRLLGCVSIKDSIKKVVPL
jgi:hypothetical protein